MKKVIAILLTAVLLTSLAACGGDKSSAKEEPAAPAASEAEKPAEETAEKPEEAAEKPAEAADAPLIGVCVFDYSNTFVSYISKGIEYYTSDGRAEIQMVDAQNDQAKQNEQIDIMVQRGAKALIVNPVDPTAALVMIEKAKAADIPIIFFNRGPDPEDLKTYEKAWYVGIELSMPGRVQAEMVMEWWAANPDADKNGDGKMQYLTLIGDLGNPDAEARTQANTDTFAEANFEVESLDSQIANWNTTKAKEVTETWIGRFGDSIEMIVSNNDAMALGAVEALRTHNKNIPIIGINALPAALELIEQDLMIGSVLSDPWGQACATIDLALNSINGETDVTAGTDWVLDDLKAVRIPDQKITKDNLNVAYEIYKNCE